MTGRYLAIKDAPVRIIETTDGLARWEPDSVALLDVPYPTLTAVLAEHGRLEPLASAPVRDRRELDQVRHSRPGVGSVWGVGLNYRSKALRTGRALPIEPILFLAPPVAVAAADSTVVVPATMTAEMDYEAEIGFVVGATIYQASADQVWPALAAVTAVNDMTARDVMRNTGVPTLAKGFPGFKPLGSSYASLDELRDPECIRVRSWVNDELRQDDTSAGMIFAVPDLIARLSQFVPLHPGDVVITGTPAGTGQDRGEFLADGDTVRIEVDAVLPLLTRVVAPPHLSSTTASALVGHTHDH